MITVPCKFDNCGLHFENKYELIFHIEEDHISPIKKRRAQYLEEFKHLAESKNDTDDQYLVVQQNYNERLHALYNQPVPMSMLCKLNPFPAGHKVRPVQPKFLTVNFCHYRKKSIAPVVNGTESTDLSSNVLSNGTAEGARRQQTAPKRLSSTSISGSSESNISSPHQSEVISSPIVKDVRNTSAMAGLLNTSTSTSISEERRFRCDTDGCKKAYKNQQGLRAHIRNAHSSAAVTASSLIVSGAGTAQRLTPAEESILNRQLPASTHHLLPSSATHVQVNNGSTGTPQSNYSVYAAHGPPVGSGSGTANTYCNVPSNSDTSNLSSNYVIVSVAQQPDVSNSTTVTTVRQVIQSQAAAAAAAAGDTASGSSSLYLAGGRFPLQRSGITGKHPCQYCPKTYKTLMNLNKHIQESHPKQVISGMSHTSVQQQYLTASSLGHGHAQSPKLSATTNDLGSSRSAHGQSPMTSASNGSTIPSQSPSYQQQQPPYHGERKSSPSTVLYSSQQQQASIGSSDSGGPLTLVAATPPPPSGMHQNAATDTTSHHYNNIQKTTQNQHQQQQYYMAASPAHAQQQQGRHQNAEFGTQHSYSPLPSTNPQQQSQTATTIYVTQQQPSPNAVQYSSQPDIHQQSTKWISWPEQSSRDGTLFARPSSADVGQLQPPPAIIVGRSAPQSQQQSVANARSTSHVQQSQQSVHHVQMQNQHLIQRPTQNASISRQSQYYQTTVQQQQQTSQGIIITSSASPSTYVITTSGSMPVSSLVTSSANTATIRISSLKQYHAHQQQPPQQQIQMQQQPQYMQVPPQHSQQSTYGQNSQQPQQQAVSISSQPPPPPQYQVTGSPSFVVRTSSIHHQPTTRYITQQQSQQYSEPLNPQQRIMSSSHLSGSSVASSRNASSLSSAGGATMAQVGGGNTVYYRTGASMSSGQPVILRTASQSSTSTPYPSIQQSHGGATTVRMIPVMSGSSGTDYNAQRSSTQQSLPQSSVYQSQSYAPTIQVNSNQLTQPSQQEHYFQTGNKTNIPQTSVRSRNIGSRYTSSGGGNTVILQQAAHTQQQALTYQYGSNNEEDINDGSRTAPSYTNSSGNANSFQVLPSTTNSSTVSTTLPYASTAAALAGADPSTPIRAIVSRGLAEQGVNRYNYTGTRGSRLDSDADNRTSFHYRTASSSVAQQHDYGKSSTYVAGPSASAGISQPNTTSGSSDGSSLKSQPVGEGFSKPTDT